MVRVAVRRVVADEFLEATLDAMRAEYHERRALFCGVLDEVGLRAARPEGAYYAMADFSAGGRRPRELAVTDASTGPAAKNIQR